MSLWRQVAELLGAEASAKLRRRYGGSRFWAPRALRPAHPLVELLGAEAAAKLVGRCGGCLISVPRGSHSRDFRDRAILSAYQGGQSAAVLARQWQISERQVRRIVAREPGR